MQQILGATGQGCHSQPCMHVSTTWEDTEITDAHVPTLNQ